MSTGPLRPSGKKISVVIPALNEEEALPGLLVALQNQTRIPDEILIVDAESTDSTSMIIEDWARRGHAVRRIKGRRGGCGIGRNIGIKAAEYEWIALIDCGMLPPPSWLKALEAAQQKLLVPAVFGKCQYLPQTPFQKTLCAVAWGTEPVAVIPCALINKSVFETVGYFREDLPAIEDQEWKRRFLRHYKTLYVMEEAVTPHVDVPNSWSVVFRKWLFYYQCAVRARVLARDQYLYLGGAIGVLAMLIVSWKVAAIGSVLYASMRGVYFPISRGTAIGWLAKPSNFARVLMLASFIDLVKGMAFALARIRTLMQKMGW